MHEMSIAVDLLTAVLRAAEEHKVEHVEEIEVTVGAMCQVVGEALRMAFEVVAAGTPAEGAALKIVEEQITAECRQCGEVFQTSVLEFLCPSCGRADVRIAFGNDVVLRSMTCRQGEGASRT
jgi:hydrogenase nickel incorporation protein HypA/HybF